MSKIIEKDLIQSLKQLKKAEPNQNWVIFCRENLIAKFPTQEREAKKSSKSFDFVSIFRHFKFPRLALRPVAVLSVIFLLIFGTGLTALSMAKNSLPGDRLYPLKIALEQARLWTTTSAEGRAQVQSEIIAVRVKELRKVIESGSSIKDKTPQIEEAVSNLQRHLSGLKDELPKLEEKTEQKKIVEVANNAAEADQVLSQATLNLSPEMEGKLTEKITEAADNLTAISSSLAALVETVDSESPAQEEPKNEDNATSTQPVSTSTGPILK